MPVWAVCCIPCSLALSQTRMQHDRCVRLGRQSRVSVRLFVCFTSIKYVLATNMCVSFSSCLVGCRDNASYDVIMIGLGSWGSCWAPMHPEIPRAHHMGPLYLLRTYCSIYRRALGTTWRSRMGWAETGTGFVIPA
ncbi:hypothetical protein F5X98DRAFT_113572 [Xylaria grammica]|nr:hypothetical protein F5X98DRAFT_113572 [Xylaria grammica]